MTDTPTLARRLAQVQARIRAAEERAGRAPDSVTLLPVSKTFEPPVIREAIAAGLHRFGENKVQEIRSKYDALNDPTIQWVLIGHLQTNKAKEVARIVSEVQSLDRLELAVALDRRLEHENRAIDVLVQVKTSSEPSKFGIPPEELPGLLKSIARHMPTLRVKGLMTMATNTDDARIVRECFRSLRLLRDQVQNEGIDGIELSRLSMGMSSDFELAIEEGSTEVRIGTAIFGGRTYA
jgi:hypothetical protein